MSKPVNTIILPAGEESSLMQAAAVLRDGGLVAFPTDTVYGVAAHGLQPEAVERIYTAKGRMSIKAIPLLLGQADDLRIVAQDIPDAAWTLAKAFWPGGLTLVLNKSSLVPDVVTAHGPTVALRMPNHPVPLRLIAMLGAPLATTSANRSGNPSPVSAEEVTNELGGTIDILLDGGRCPGGVESTVLDLSSGTPVVLRQGAIATEDLEKALGKPVARSKTL